MLKNKTKQNRNCKKYSQTGITVESIQIKPVPEGKRSCWGPSRLDRHGSLQSSQWSKHQKLHRPPELFQVLIYCRTLIVYEFWWFDIYDSLSNQSDYLNHSDKDSDWLIVASILKGPRGLGERGIGDHVSCFSASCMRYNRKEQTEGFSNCK